MATRDYKYLIYEKKPPIAYVTLNRPEKLNALSPELMQELKEALLYAGWQENDIKVIILKGAGRCFSSGFDIGAEPDMDVVKWSTLLRQSHQKYWDAFWDNPKPIIAQIHSFCLAGAMGVACFSDLRICSDDALFGYPRIRAGGPFLWAVWPWMLGIGKAKELLFTGNLIDAQEAYRLGLVNKVVPIDKLDEETTKMAITISKVSAVSVEYSKRAVNKAYELMNIKAAMESSDDFEAVCNSTTSAGSMPENAEWHRLQREEGLKAALDWRKNRFADEDAWWKERAARPGVKQ